LAFSPDGKRLIAEDRIQLIGKGPDRFGATIWDAGTWYELLNMPDMKLEESPCRWVNGQRTWTADIAREMRTQEVDSNGGDRKTAEAGSKAAP
jgi:hypothetical protein